MFSPYVSAQLKFYVYRLIDPRNGETFYVGKGTGNRVFAHVNGELTTTDDALTDKLLRIREIRLSGFEVAHVIHRHGLSEEQAFEVEGALIDAYPEVTNLASGRAADERGVMHAKEIIERYEAPEAKFQHKVLLITINRSAPERDSINEAVRYAWKLDPRKAKQAEYVLAVQQGLI
ncbi:MAG: LEM-3-like GIY-YIG domain-containing protein, partial [Acidimicrobiia bacterium]